MTIKLTHCVVTFSSPTGDKNVTAIQNLEMADAKGNHPKKKEFGPRGFVPNAPPPLGSTIALDLCMQTQ